MRANRTLEKCILLLLASVWALVCLFPIWVLFSGTFSPVSYTHLTLPTT